MAETIDNLPPQVYQDYAASQSSKQAYPLTADITKGRGTSLQVAVLAPQSAYLEELTGALGAQTLASFSPLNEGFNPLAFTHAVCPALLNKDTPRILQNLSELKGKYSEEGVNKLILGVNQIATLNEEGHFITGRCNQLKQG